MTPWVREAVIRGDVPALGLVMTVSGAVMGAVWLSGAGEGPGWLALGLIPAGLGLVVWGRSRYRELLGEVVRRFAGHDPGPSPVAWIAEEVWRERNRFNPELDAADELRAEVDPKTPPFARAAKGAFEAPVLRPVSDAERDLCRTGSASGVDTPRGDADALLEVLRTTPGRFIATGIRWPVCCGGLTVLAAVGPGSGPDGAMVLRDAGQEDALDASMHGFRCPRCGRGWRTTPVW